MLNNYLKIAWRSLWKYRGYTAINMIGLSLSICFSLLISLWVNEEYSTDKFHVKKERLLKVFNNGKNETGAIATSGTQAYPLIEVLNSQIPSLEAAAGFHYTHLRTVHKDGKKFNAKGSFASFNIFDMFSFPLLEGSTIDSESELLGIYLSEQLTRQYFGENWQGQVVGRTIKIDGNWEKGLTDYKVLGVFEDVPDNSTMQFDFITNLEWLLSENKWLEEWGNRQLSIYALANDQASTEQVNREVREVLQDYSETNDWLSVVPFSSLYLRGEFENGQIVSGRIKYVRIFSLAVLFLLIIACVNFINLTTARSSARSQEVGIRKIVGANRYSLIYQFLVETAVVVIGSILLSIVAAYQLLPIVNQWTVKELVLDMTSPLIWYWIGGLLLTLTLLAGLYPSWILAKNRPLHMIKKQMSDRWSGASLRKALVIFQFVVAIVLFSTAAIVREQIDFIFDQDIGMDLSNIISIESTEPTSQKYEVYKQRLKASPSIQSVSSSSHMPLITQSSTSDILWPGKDPEQIAEMHMMWTDHQFASVFDIELLDGIYHEKPNGDPPAELVINEAAVEMMGLTDPVGTQVTFWEEKATIIGVVKNFHNQTMHHRILPMTLLLQEDFMSQFHVKPVAGQVEEAIVDIQRVHREIAGSEPLSYSFVDEAYATLYQSEVLTGKIADYFAILALIIACLGLLGLAAFMMRQRIREIGVRKILGASVGEIILLLSNHFLSLIAIGLLVAIPISWYLSSQWLSQFTYHISFNWGLVLTGGLAVILVALSTILWQGYQAASTNPVDTLHDD